MNNFIHFGCWNNMNNKSDSKIPIFELIVNKINKEFNKYQTLIVAGDNYYPTKTKQTNNTGKTIKTKKYSKQKLTQGFELLKSINITNKYLLWGNHDIEYIDKENKNNNNLTQLNIIDSQLNSIKDTENILHNTIIDLNNQLQPLFHIYHSKNNTLIILLDTSLIAEKDKFNKLKYYYMKTLKITGEFTYELYISIIMERYKKLIDYIKEDNFNRLTNIVFVGHHPIYYIRTKEKKDKKTKKKNNNNNRKSKNEESKNEKSKHKKFKQKSILYTNENLLDLFKEFLKAININSKIYYLCADLHMYQYGIINIPLGDNIFKIEQYICGTGGTVLDSLSETDVEIYKAETKQIIENKEIPLYEYGEHYINYGFLTCDYNNNDEINFKFIEL